MQSRINATWDEIDLDKREWIIPADRMKAAREHRIPLAPRVVDLLEQLPREQNNPLFVGERRIGKPIGDRSLFLLLRELRPNITVHGFRSSFSDWAHEQTDASHHAVEMSLAHAVGDQTARAYQRGDLFEKRRALMDAWSAFCSSNPEATNVVTFKPAYV